MASVLAACSAPASETLPDDDDVYGVHYRLIPKPELDGIAVELTVTQSQHLLRRYDMRLGEVDPESVDADGDVAVEDGRAVWDLPEKGGTMRWFAPLGHKRGNGGFDTYITADWALFRAEDAIPIVRTRTLRGAKSATELSFSLPDRWSSLTQYAGDDDLYPIDNPERDFDRPTGWIIAGRYGSRAENIAGVRVIVAGPMGQGIHRMDALAFLNWTLPEIVDVLPDFPNRLTVFSARDPMWRGGLSAPASFFLHADRPLISENGTSSLLHEVMHVGTGLRGERGADWIVEGLAEYYGLEALRRSGTISSERYAYAMEDLAEWAEEADGLCVRRSSGPTTAAAVLKFAQLDEQIQRASDFSLDDLLRRIVTEDRDVSVASLQASAEELVGTVPDAITSANLPGCSD